MTLPWSQTAHGAPLPASRIVNSLDLYEALQSAEKITGGRTQVDNFAAVEELKRTSPPYQRPGSLGLFRARDDGFPRAGSPTPRSSKRIDPSPAKKYGTGQPILPQADTDPDNLREHYEKIRRELFQNDELMAAKAMPATAALAAARTPEVLKDVHRATQPWSSSSVRSGARHRSNTIGTVSSVRNFEVDPPSPTLQPQTAAASVATPATAAAATSSTAPTAAPVAPPPPPQPQPVVTLQTTAAPITAPSSGATNSNLSKLESYCERVAWTRKIAETAPRGSAAQIAAGRVPKIDDHSGSAQPVEPAPPPPIPTSSFVATAITRSSPPPPRSSPPPPRSASPPPPRFSPPPPRLTPPSRNRSPSPPPPDFSRPVEEYTLKSKWNYDPLLRPHDRLIDAANGSPPMGGGDDDPHEWNPAMQEVLNGLDDRAKFSDVLERFHNFIGVRKSSALTVATRQQPTPTQQTLAAYADKHAEWYLSSTGSEEGNGKRRPWGAPLPPPDQADHGPVRYSPPVNSPNVGGLTRRRRAELAFDGRRMAS